MNLLPVPESHLAAIWLLERDFFSCLFGEENFQHVLRIGFGAAAAARAGGAGRRQGAGEGVILAEGKEKLDKKPIEDEDQDTKAAKKDTAPGTTNMTL